MVLSIGAVLLGVGTDGRAEVGAGTELQTLEAVALLEHVKGSKHTVSLWLPRVMARQKEVC